MTEPLLVCPACGKEQTPRPECRRCGLVFAKHGQGRSLFTARRLPERGGQALRHPGQRRSERRVRVGWLAAAALLGGVIGWALRDAPAPEAETVVVGAPEASGPTAAGPTLPPEAAPGLSVAQLRALQDRDDWSVPSPFGPTGPLPVAVPPEELDGAVDDGAGASSPAAVEAAAPAPATLEGPRPLAIPGPPEPIGQTRVTEGRTESVNERYDPVGSRGWYAGVDGLERALDERDRTGRTLVVYVHAPWCPHCRRFRDEYLTHPAMLRFLDRVVRVHVNAEASEEAAGLATDWGVEGFPSFFVVPAGTERPERLHPFLGDVTLSPERFAGLAERVSRGGILPVPAMLSADGVLPAW